MAWDVGSFTKMYQGDVSNKAFFSRLPTDFDLVINFAGVQPSILTTSEHTDMTKTFNDYIYINVIGVFNILEFVRLNSISNYIYTTTHRDYENYWKDGVALKNNLPTSINYNGDHSMYAITKTAAKMIGDYYGSIFNTRVFNLRLPMIFLVPDSPYYLANGKPKVMPFLKIIKNAMDGRNLEIWGKPHMPRDYVYIDNLLSMIELCYRSNIDGGTFNVGTGEGVTTERFVKTIGQLFSSRDNIKYYYRPDLHTYKSAIYDITDEREKLGYEPVLLVEMLEKMKNKIISEDYSDKWGW